MTAPGSGSGGCNTVTMGTKPEGYVFYNADHHVMEGCAGSVWRPVGQQRTEWIKSIEDSDNSETNTRYGEWFRTVAQLADGDFVFAGGNYYGGPEYLMKVSPEGSILWGETVYRFHAYYIGQIAATPDGGFVAIYGSEGSDAFVSKFDTDGAEVWTDRFSLPNYSFAGITQLSHGGFVITGRGYDVGDDNPLLVMKFSSSGAEQWSKTYDISPSQGVGYEDSGKQIREDSDGNLVVLAQVKDKSGGFTKWAVLKLDSAGNVLWLKRMKDANKDWRYAADKGLAVIGTDIYAMGVSGAGSPEGAYLTKLDSDGNEIWSRRFAQTNDAPLYNALAATHDGNLVMLGTTNNTPHEAIILAKVSAASGATLWSKQLPGGAVNSGWDAFDAGVTVAGDGDIVFAILTQIYGNGGTYSSPIDGIIGKVTADGKCGGCGEFVDFDLPNISATMAFDSPTPDVAVMDYTETTTSVSVSSETYTVSQDICDPGGYPTTDLVGWWPLDETSGTVAYDSSGNGNDGTMINGLDAGNDSIPGKVGTGLDLDGVDDNVYIGDPADGSLDFSSTQNFSYSAWIKTSAFDGTFAVSKKNTQEGYEILVGRYNVPGRFVCRLGDAVTHELYSTYFDGNDDDNWHLVTCVVDRDTQELHIYGDGVEIAPAVDISSLGDLDTTEDLRLGARGAGNSRCQCGLDDVRIYDRALSAEAAYALYDKTSCKYPTAPEGIIYYNSSYKTMQYCNGSSWLSVGKPPTDCAPPEDFTTPGMTTTNVPTGCTKATLEAWGAGGGGGVTGDSATRATGGGGGGSGVERDSPTTVLIAAGGGGGGGADSSNSKGGGGGAYVISSDVAVTPGETFNIYVGGGGESGCTSNNDGDGGEYNGGAAADGVDGGSSTWGGGGGNSNNGNGGDSVYGGGGGDASSGVGGTSTYGGAGGNSNEEGYGGGGYGGTVTNGSDGSGYSSRGGYGAVGGGYVAGRGGDGDSCGSTGGNGRVRVIWSY